MGRARIRMARAAVRLSCMGLAVPTLSCSDGTVPRSPGVVPVLALSERPVLEIGEREGDPDYLFQDVVGTLLLASGGIAVSDAGSQQISVYGNAGALLRRWGGRGEGPGEFRGLSRIYLGAGDSILALDGATGRLSAFSGDGSFSHQLDAVALTGDTLFSLDVWLHGRFWVEGALDEPRRRTVRAALDRMPPPPPGEHRMARVAREGRLWVREPRAAPGGTRTWTLFTNGGDVEGVAHLPERFDPRDMHASRVAGRWLGEDDVHFVRVYDLVPTTDSATSPAWTLAAPTPPDLAGPDLEEFKDRIRDAIRRLASAQEIHYSTRYTYTAAVDSLAWERPEGVGVDLVAADRRGWAGVFTHPALDFICGLGYGASVPPGWLAGHVVCGPPTSPLAPGG